MKLHWLAPALLALAAPLAHDPCVRPTKAGTVVQGDARICPGRYRIPDPDGHGVIVAGNAGTRIDLTNVTIESGDTIPADFRGVGVLAEDIDRVSIIGGRIRGYQYGIRISGGKGHRIVGSDVSGSRAQALRSTADRYDERDWLDIFHPDSFAAYGSGISLRGTDGADVRGVTATGAQNGIGLMDATGTILAGNDVSNNSGWGIHLWHSSHSIITQNQAHHNVRCESEQYRRGCDSAGILLRERSDSNVITDNDLSFSGDGFFLSGQPPLVHPSVGNLVMRNDATGAWHNAFESTFSWGNRFLDNRADSADYGFWLGYSTANLVQHNSIVGTRSAGVAIEHGQDNTITDNVIVAGDVGVHLFAPDSSARASRGSRVDDNVLARLDRGVVLERSSGTRVRDNMFDQVGDALVADAASSDAVVSGNIFLRAFRHFIVAPRLDAGQNFWASPSPATTRDHIAGQVNLSPWHAARDAGY